MGEMLSYSVYSGLLLLGGYLIYVWLLAGEKLPGLNRCLLWTIYAVSFAAWPLKNLLAGVLSASAPVEATIAVELPTLVGAGAATPSSVVTLLLVWIYFGGMVAVGLWSAFIALRIRAIIRSGSHRDCGAYTLVILPGHGVAPFSWGRYVVVSREDFDSAGEMIVEHELQHLGRRHWIDLLVAQVVCIVEWFNPAAWLMRDELKAVHEFQADSGVIAGGSDPITYQRLLIKKAVGTRFQSLANSLNHSNLKKRITMMYNQKPKGARRLRPFALVPALALALAVTALPAVAEMLSEIRSTDLTSPEITEKSEPVQTESPVGYTIDSEVASEAAEPGEVESVEAAEIVAEVPADKPVMKSVADVKTVSSKAGKAESKSVSVSVSTSGVNKGVMPEYPGGITELMNFLMQNVKYPEAAKAKGLEGKVVIRFTVDAKGKVVNPTVIRSVDPMLDAEALRVVGKMPAWKPATVDGKPVDSQFVVPVSFNLSGADKNGTTSTGNTSSTTVSIMRSGVDSDSKPEIYVNGKRHEGETITVASGNSVTTSLQIDGSENRNGRVDVEIRN